MAFLLVGLPKTRLHDHTVYIFYYVAVCTDLPEMVCLSSYHKYVLYKEEQDFTDHRKFAAGSSLWWYQQITGQNYQGAPVSVLIPHQLSNINQHYLSLPCCYIP